MSHYRNDSYAAQVAPSRDRLLTRMLPAAELLPGVVASRDARAVETLLAKRTKVELHALVVILASWLAGAEEAAGKDAA